MIGFGKTQKLVVSAVHKNRLASGKLSNRELVTLGEAISAGGYVIPPLIIMKSSKGWHMEDWYKNTSLPEDALVATSETAYINDEIALDWISHYYIHSKRYQRGRYRLLLLDGHASHKTYEFLSFCLEKDIIPFFLVPHTTHICQPGGVPGACTEK